MFSSISNLFFFYLQAILFDLIVTSEPPAKREIWESQTHCDSTANHSNGKWKCILIYSNIWAREKAATTKKWRNWRAKTAELPHVLRMKKSVQNSFFLDIMGIRIGSELKGKHVIYWNEKWRINMFSIEWTIKITVRIKRKKYVHWMDVNLQWPRALAHHHRFHGNKTC